MTSASIGEAVLAGWKYLKQLRTPSVSSLYSFSSSKNTIASDRKGGIADIRIEEKVYFGRDLEGKPVLTDAAGRRLLRCIDKSTRQFEEFDYDSPIISMSLDTNEGGDGLFMIDEVKKRLIGNRRSVPIYNAVLRYDSNNSKIYLVDFNFFDHRAISANILREGPMTWRDRYLNLHLKRETNPFPVDKESNYEGLVERVDEPVLK